MADQIKCFFNPPFNANIINKSKLGELNISKYDLEFNMIKEILEDANTISLFDSNKLIIVENAFIFSRTTKKIDDVDLLEEYLKNNNSNVIIIFINYNEKIDSVKKIVKHIKEKGVIKEFNTLKNITSNVLKMFDDYKISSDAVQLLIDRVGNNLEIMYQEIEKLKIYKIDDKIITKEDTIIILIDFLLYLNCEFHNYI